MPLSTNKFKFLFSPVGVSFLVFFWCTGLAIGFTLLVDHGAKPSLQFPSPQHWPSDVEIQRATNVSTLLFFVHPQCPCTFASLAELERLIAQSDSSLQTVLILNCPIENLHEWMQTLVANRAKGIPGARIFVDSDGKLSAKFKASVSGQCLLYSPNGQLLFQGGLTASRGHEGDNFGQTLLIHMLADNEPKDLENLEPQVVPVYGCELIQSHSPSLPSTKCCKSN